MMTTQALQCLTELQQRYNLANTFTVASFTWVAACVSFACFHSHLTSLCHSGIIVLKEKKNPMKDCFPWLLNFSSNQCEPSNSRSRFGSPIPKEEHNFLQNKTDLELLQDKWQEWSFTMPKYNVHLDNYNVKSLCYHQLSHLYWDTKSDSSVPPTEVHTHMAASRTRGGSCPLPGFCHFSKQTQQATHPNVILTKSFQDVRTANIKYILSAKEQDHRERISFCCSCVFEAFDKESLSKWFENNPERFTNRTKLETCNSLFPTVRISQGRSLLELTGPAPIPAWSPADKTTKNSFFLLFSNYSNPKP